MNGVELAFSTLPIPPTSSHLTIFTPPNRSSLFETSWRIIQCLSITSKRHFTARAKWKQPTSPSGVGSYHTRSWVRRHVVFEHDLITISFSKRSDWILWGDGQDIRRNVGRAQDFFYFPQSCKHSQESRGRSGREMETVTDQRTSRLWTTFSPNHKRDTRAYKIIWYAQQELTLKDL